MSAAGQYIPDLVPPAGFPWRVRQDRQRQTQPVFDDLVETREERPDGGFDLIWTMPGLGVPANVTVLAAAARATVAQPRPVPEGCEGFVEHHHLELVDYCPPPAVTVEVTAATATASGGQIDTQGATAATATPPAGEPPAPGASTPRVEEETLGPNGEAATGRTYLRRLEDGERDHDERIPLKLRERNQWVVWRREERLDSDNTRRMTKVPYRADAPGILASSTTPATWSTYEKARAAAAAHAGVDGVGFVVTENDPICALDLDDCIVDGNIHPDAQRVIDDVDSYTEVSPSGRGIRVVLQGAKPGSRCVTEGTPWGGKIEVYDQKRYVTITGERLDGTPCDVAERQQALDVLYHRMFPEPTPPSARGANGTSPPPTPLDDTSCSTAPGGPATAPATTSPPCTTAATYPTSRGTTRKRTSTCASTSGTGRTATPTAPTASSAAPR